MVRYREQMFREMLHERAFRFQRSLGIVGQPYAVRHTKHVGVDRHRRLVEHHRQYHISRLAAHSRQFNQFIHRRRHFPAISLHKHPRRSYQRTRLVVWERNTLYILKHRLPTRPGKSLGRRIVAEKRRSDDVYTLVCALRRQDYCHKQLERRPIMEFRFGFRHILAEP